MEYLGVSVQCSESLSEILITELAETGLDSFMENETGFEGFGLVEQVDKTAIEEVFKQYASLGPLEWKFVEEAKVNWNQEWEKHYDPIEVADKIYVRADFHPKKPEFEHEIVITPKMSFGTGHHATTHLMLSFQLQLSFQGKKVLDAGCGTGILAIMASKLGASEVIAYDIDSWCVENTNENLALNAISNIEVLKGVISDFNFEPFDIILANINKNVLLEELQSYASVLKAEGKLLLSGFYESDMADLKKAAKALDLHYETHQTKDNWASILFIKH